MQHAIHEPSTCFRIVGGADIVVAAVCRPELIKGAWIKSGAVVIGAGYNPGNIGDVEYDTAAQRVHLITPVPGGVAPPPSPSCSTKPSQQP
ncbi:hypothetical protein [Mycolicibacterium sp. 624]|uniref:hypothetical protein n=1 Tax=Mycolicibacterium sp. 624 TaxID=3156314 RepID=UPI003397328D